MTHEQVTDPVKIACFGGCTLNGPIHARRKELSSVCKAIGFGSHAPISQSCGGALQLLQVMKGEAVLPPLVRRLFHSDADYAINTAESGTVAGAELFAVETSTPVELSYDGYVINQNRFREVVMDAFRARPELKRPANFWNAHGLMKADETLRAQHAGTLLALLDPAREEDRFLIDAVEKTRSCLKTEDDYYKALMGFRASFAVPGFVVLHTFSYMPDGRPVAWPADFREVQERAARRAELPVFDPAPVVQAAGTERAMEEDLRHYRPDYLAEMGWNMLQFIRENFPEVARRRQAA